MYRNLKIRVPKDSKSALVPPRNKELFNFKELSMINFLSLSKYLTFFVLPAVCGNALATEPDGSFEAALYDAVISNLGIYLFVMVCCFTVYGIYKIKKSSSGLRSQTWEPVLHKHWTWFPDRDNFCSLSRIPISCVPLWQLWRKSFPTCG